MEFNKKNITDIIDLSYFLGNYNETSKFIINDKIKIYCFRKDGLLVVAKTPKNHYTLFINKKTYLEDVIDYCEKIMFDIEESKINIEKVNMENLTVDRIENIYYTILTEDDIPIILDETYFDKLPKDGDILDSSLNILEKETIDRTTIINNKFQSLLKKR